MVSIDKVTQKTQNRFVNLYDLDVTHKNGEASHYYVASRAKTEDELKLRTGDNHPDGLCLRVPGGSCGERRGLPRRCRPRDA